MNECEKVLAEVADDALRRCEDLAAERDRLAADLAAATTLLRGLADVCDTIDGDLRSRRLIDYEKAVREWYRGRGFRPVPDAWMTPDERRAALGAPADPAPDELAAWRRVGRALADAPASVRDADDAEPIWAAVQHLLAGRFDAALAVLRRHEDAS